MPEDVARLIFKGVLVDFGGTLAYIDEVENSICEKALASTLNQHGYNRNLEDLCSTLDIVYASSMKGELKSIQEFWGLVLRKLGIPEQPELINDLESVRNNHAGRIWKLYDRVPATLLSLKKKYKMALVSNCAVGTDTLIESIGLAHFFRCTVLSYQVGVRKPDKRMYLEALKCLGQEAHECVFVADEISDLEGARAVGLKTILVRQRLNRFQGAKDPGFKPDFECDRISEITQFL